MSSSSTSFEKGNNRVVNLRSSALIRHCDFNLLGDSLEIELIKFARKLSERVLKWKQVKPLIVKDLGRGRGLKMLSLGFFTIKLSTCSGSSKCMNGRSNGEIAGCWRVSKGAMNDEWPNGRKRKTQIRESDCDFERQLLLTRLWFLRARARLLSSSSVGSDGRGHRCARVSDVVVIVVMVVVVIVIPPSPSSNALVAPRPTISIIFFFLLFWFYATNGTWIDFSRFSFHWFLTTIFQMQPADEKKLSSPGKWALTRLVDHLRFDILRTFRKV